MPELVTCTVEDSVCRLTLDDGKANVMSVAMIQQINQGLDRARSAKSAVVITGRAGVFSGGFDLAVFKAGGAGLVEMLSAGAALTERLLSFPTPVVIACGGHAVAMGAFVVLCGDYRLGIADDSRILRANEVAIGMTLPRFATEVCRQRLSPPHLHRVTINAEAYWGERAVTAGFLDQLVPAEDLLPVAQKTARELASLDMTAHAATKLRCREPSLRALRAAIEADIAEWTQAVAS